MKLAIQPYWILRMASESGRTAALVRCCSPQEQGRWFFCRLMHDVKERLLKPAIDRRQKSCETKIEPVAGVTLLYLPPYSPDLNPIEQLFAKLKALLRKAAARTYEALIDTIAAALSAFTPGECANCFTNAGYSK